MSRDLHAAAASTRPGIATDFSPGRVWLHLVTTTGLAYFERLANGLVVGEEHLRKVMDDGCVLAMNHVSYLDWIVVWAWFRYRLGRNITFLGKHALFKHRIWAPLMQHAGVVRVSDEGDRFLDKEAYRRLRQSKVIGIFPEGTRSPDGNLLPGKTGAVKLALKLRRPILPLALDGFHHAWPRTRALPRLRPPACRILIGEPWQPTPVAQCEENAQLHEHTQALMQQLAALLGQTHVR